MKAISVYTDFHLANLTSWRIGGLAKTYIKPNNIKLLSDYLKKLNKNEKILWLGLGSNVLIRDSGFQGTVIHTLPDLNNINVKDRLINGLTIRAEAGSSCAKFAKFAIKHNLKDMEFFSGIPGTMGGALAINAGAFESECWDNIIFVETIDRNGKIRLRDKNDYEISYRKVKGPDMEWFLAGYWFFHYATSKDNVKQKIKELLSLRKARQPIGKLTCGSVFKNPQGHYAANLIKSAGLKGLQVGDAIVSEKHANFIINNGKATSNDIEELINKIMEKVKLIHKIQLELEIVVI